MENLEELLRGDHVPDQTQDTSTVQSQTQWCPSCNVLAKQMEEKYSKNFMAMKQKIYFTDNLIRMHQESKIKLQKAENQIKSLSNDKELMRSQLQLMLSKEEPTVSENKRLQEEVVTLRKEAETLKIQLHAMDESRRMHEETIKILKVQDLGTLHEVKKRHRQQVAELKEEIAEKTEGRNKLIKRNKKLQDKLKAMQEKRRPGRTISGSSHDEFELGSRHRHGRSRGRSRSGHVDEYASVINTKKMRLDSEGLSDVTETVPIVQIVSPEKMEKSYQDIAVTHTPNRTKEKVAYITSTTTEDSASESKVAKKKSKEIVSPNATKIHLSNSQKEAFKNQMLEIKRKRALAAFQSRPSLAQKEEYAFFMRKIKKTLSENAAIITENNIMEYVTPELLQYCELHHLDNQEKLVLRRFLKFHEGIFTELELRWLQNVAAGKIGTDGQTLLLSEQSASESDAPPHNRQQPPAEDNMITTESQHPDPQLLTPQEDGGSKRILRTDKRESTSAYIPMPDLNDVTNMTPEVPSEETSRDITALNKPLKLLASPEPVKSAGEGQKGKLAVDLDLSADNSTMEHTPTEPLITPDISASWTEAPFTADTSMDSISAGPVTSGGQTGLPENVDIRTNDASGYRKGTEVPDASGAENLNVTMQSEFAKESKIHTSEVNTNQPTSGEPELNETMQSEISKPRRVSRFNKTGKNINSGPTKKDFRADDDSGHATPGDDVGSGKTGGGATFSAQEVDSSDRDSHSAGDVQSPDQHVSKEKRAQYVATVQAAIHLPEKQSQRTVLSPEKSLVKKRKSSDRSNQGDFQEPMFTPKATRIRTRSMGIEGGEQSPLRRSRRISEKEEVASSSSDNQDYKSPRRRSCDEKENAPNRKMVLPPRFKVQFVKGKKYASKTKATTSPTKTPKPAKQKIAPLPPNETDADRMSFENATESLSALIDSSLSSDDDDLPLSRISATEMGNVTTHDFSRIFQEMALPLTLSPLLDAHALADAHTRSSDEDQDQYMGDFLVSNADQSKDAESLTDDGAENHGRFIDNASASVGGSFKSGGSSAESDGTCLEPNMDDASVSVPDDCKGRESISPSSDLCTAISFAPPPKTSAACTVKEPLCQIKSQVTKTQNSTKANTKNSATDNTASEVSSLDIPSKSNQRSFPSSSFSTDILKPRRFSCEAPEMAVSVPPIKPMVKGASFDHVPTPLSSRDLRKTSSLPLHRKEGDVPSHWHSSMKSISKIATTAENESHESAHHEFFSHDAAPEKSDVSDLKQVKCGNEELSTDTMETVSLNMSAVVETDEMEAIQTASDLDDDDALKKVTAFHSVASPIAGFESGSDNCSRPAKESEKGDMTSKDDEKQAEKSYTPQTSETSTRSKRKAAVNAKSKIKVSMSGTTLDRNGEKSEQLDELSPDVSDSESQRSRPPAKEIIVVQPMYEVTPRPKRGPAKENSSQSGPLPKVFAPSSSQSQVPVPTEEITLTSMEDGEAAICRLLKKEQVKVGISDDFIWDCIVHVLKEEEEELDFNIFEIIEDSTTADVTIEDLPGPEQKSLQLLIAIHRTGCFEGNFIIEFALPRILQVLSSFGRMFPVGAGKPNHVKSDEDMKRANSLFSPFLTCRGRKGAWMMESNATMAILRQYAFLCRSVKSYHALLTFCDCCLKWNTAPALSAVMECMACWPTAVKRHPRLSQTVFRIVGKEASAAALQNTNEGNRAMDKVRLFATRCGWEYGSLVKADFGTETLEECMTKVMAAELTDGMKTILNRLGTKDSTTVQVFDDETMYAILCLKILLKGCVVRQLKEIIDGRLWPLLNLWARHTHIHGDVDEGREVSNATAAALMEILSGIVCPRMVVQRFHHKNQALVPHFLETVQVLCALMDQFSKVYVQKAPRLVQCATAAFLIQVSFCSPLNISTSLRTWLVATNKLNPVHIESSLPKKHYNFDIITALSGMSEANIRDVAFHLDVTLGLQFADSLVSVLWPHRLRQQARIDITTLPTDSSLP